MHRRAFVLVPLNDLAPDLELPGLGPLLDYMPDMQKPGLWTLPASQGD
jgi:7,8-dihydro-6-hydroxymethylpterin-pyrophosphokinase